MLEDGLESIIWYRVSDLTKQTIKKSHKDNLQQTTDNNAISQHQWNFKTTLVASRFECLE